MVHRRPIIAGALAAIMALAASSGFADANRAAPSPAQSSGDDPREMWAEMGLQQVPKARLTAAAERPAGPNPYLALVADPSQIDMFGWKQWGAQQAKRATTARSGAHTALADDPLIVDEAEPAAISGANDTPARAQFVARFGTGPRRVNAARILGTLAPPAPPEALDQLAEDNGAIPIAPEVELPAGERVVTPGEIGDGPHGSAGSGSGDFDFISVSGQRGQVLVVDTDTLGGALDTVVGLWDSDGELIDLNDDDGDTFDSLLITTLGSTGTFYVSIGDFGSPFPEDPFDSGSGFGAEGEGAYSVTLSIDAPFDLDHFSFGLRKGDVFSATSADPATQLVLYDRRTRNVIGSTQDASYVYPSASPLPGGGSATLAHVADEDARYALLVTGAKGGDYRVTAEVYRAGLEGSSAGAVQTVFIDFDGARVNTGIWGGRGVSNLSPLSGFLGRWGLGARSESRVIDAVLTTVTENLRADLRRSNPEARLRVLNSRDDADPFGGTNVSRVIVGGTIEESGVPTIGIAQSIDPGNFETEETALVLLDILSDPRGEDGDPSLNTYLRRSSDRVAFVGQAVGNVVSHEIGHYIGSFHVAQFNRRANLMDQGGNFPVLYGVGPDGIGGTADDPDVDFGEDTYNPNEGFTGIEDTRTTSAYGLTRGAGPR